MEQQIPTAVPAGRPHRIPVAEELEGPDIPGLTFADADRSGVPLALPADSYEPTDDQIMERSLINIKFIFDKRIQEEKDKFEASKGDEWDKERLEKNQHVYDVAIKTMEDFKIIWDNRTNLDLDEVNPFNRTEIYTSTRLKLERLKDDYTENPGAAALDVVRAYVIYLPSRDIGVEIVKIMIRYALGNEAALNMVTIRDAGMVYMDVLKRQGDLQTYGPPRQQFMIRPEQHVKHMTYDQVFGDLMSVFPILKEFEATEEEDAREWMVDAVRLFMEGGAGMSEAAFVAANFATHNPYFSDYSNFRNYSMDIKYLRNVIEVHEESQVLSQILLEHGYEKREEEQYDIPEYDAPPSELHKFNRTEDLLQYMFPENGKISQSEWNDTGTDEKRYWFSGDEMGDHFSGQVEGNMWRLPDNHEKSNIEPIAVGLVKKFRREDYMFLDCGIIHTEYASFLYVQGIQVDYEW